MISSDSTLYGKRSAHFHMLGWRGTKLCISIDSSTYRLSQIVERQARVRDRLHPAIDSSFGDKTTTESEKKGELRGCGHSKEGGLHRCISEWRGTMTDGASGDVYKCLQHIQIYCRHSLCGR